MNLPLSNRLLTCADFVSPGDRVADIGCDHGYLGIYLLKNGIARSVIASDVNQMPLQSALRNAVKFGVREQMEFYLSDGAGNIPRDFSCLVCAGMGADTMIHILTNAPWLKDTKYRLILQCQSKTPSLRQYLSDNGWQITEETVIRDGRFLYTVMEVCYAPQAPRLTAGQCYFPPALLENPTRELPAYYQWVVEGLRIATAHRAEPEQKTALAEVEALAQNETLSWLKEEPK